MNLSEILTAEHRQIDAGIEAFLDGLAAGNADPEPLLAAIRALRRHIYIEEEFLFPPIQRGGLVMPVMVMQREHGTLWSGLDRLEQGLADARGPDQQALIDECRELLQGLDAHNGKEEPIIYPQTAQALSEADANTVRALLDSGTTPDGWTCRVLR